jgi:hypothetical protein
MYERHDPDGNWSVGMSRDGLIEVNVARAGPSEPTPRLHGSGCGGGRPSREHHVVA